MDGDGFGTKTSGLLANSGNASGIAVFEGTTVNAATKPVDVVFIGSGGSLYTSTPTEAGYRIANTDFYDVINPITLQPQGFYRAGSNTLNFVYYTADLPGKWIKARVQNNVLLTKTSTPDKIEGEEQRNCADPCNALCAFFERMNRDALLSDLSLASARALVLNNYESQWVGITLHGRALK